MKVTTYPVAAGGLATEATKSVLPYNFCSKLENRFINIYGEAEKRPGLKEIVSIGDGARPNEITASLAAVNGNVDLLTEFVGNDAVAGFCSVITSGRR